MVPPSLPSPPSDEPSSSTGGIGALPTLLALDAYPVLAGRRRATSLQIDDTYFEGQTTALRTAEAPSLTRRLEVIRQSKDLYDDIRIDLDSLTEATLATASDRFRRLLGTLPETGFLDDAFPGTCYVVPEWVRTETGVQYGARAYFFRDDAPDPGEVIDRNVEATVGDSFADFERYQGRLHGYPECCVEAYATGDRKAGVVPERRSVEPIAEHVDADRIDGGPDTSVSIADVLPAVFESPHVYAFFTREFFPEPGCSTARKQGIDVYETLLEEFPERLVRDYFRFNAGWSYLVAQSTGQLGSSRPRPGTLGREHLLFYLPLSVVRALPRYRETGE